MKHFLTLIFFIFSLAPIFAQTFTEDIAEIIYNKCSTCHRPGEIGPQSLTNYDEVKNWASTIKFVTSMKIMPPWQADHQYSRFLGENFLTQTEIDLISDWVDNGAEKGPDAAEPNFPDFPEGSLLGEPDLVLTMTQAHVHQGNNQDVYWYYVLPSGLTEDKVIKAIEFRPGNSKIVHHALMFEDTEGIAAARDAQNPSQYGFPEFGGFAPGGNGFEILGQKEYPGYVPGQKPIRFPEGMGQTLSAGSDVVVQVHYAPWSTTEEDLSSVNIFFADENEPIDRFVQDSVMLPFNIAPGGLLGFAQFRLDPEEIQTFHGTWELEEDLSFVGLSPHMHLLGQDWEVYIEHTDGSMTNLIRIPEWDFNWQGNYFFPRLIVAEAGSTIHAYATYDNTSENPNNPSSPPISVGWGERTIDEMYYLPLMYVPYQEGDENVIFDNVLDIDDEINIEPNNIAAISPNPVSDLAFADINLENGGVLNIDLLNIKGQKIRSIRKNEFFSIGEHRINFRTDNLSEGVYMIHINGKNFSLTEKFVKN